MNNMGCTLFNRILFQSLHKVLDTTERNHFEIISLDAIVVNASHINVHRVSDLLSHIRFSCTLTILLTAYDRSPLLYYHQKETPGFYDSSAFLFASAYPLKLISIQGLEDECDFIQVGDL